MWEMIGILLGVGLIVWIELPYLIRRKLYRELVVFSCVLAFGLGVSIVHAMKVPLPNPLDWIRAVHDPIYEMWFGKPK